MKLFSGLFYYKTLTLLLHAYLLKDHNTLLLLCVFWLIENVHGCACAASET